jgi:hypothetical protein
VMTMVDLHPLVDELPEASLEPVGHPVRTVLGAAPWDDEPYTADQRAAVEDAFADRAPSVPVADAERELLAD